ncbi:MAG: DUF6485 family protein [bacterium]
MAKECNVKENTIRCNCTYSSCSRIGICCECISYHRKRKELPACYFPPDIERTYDRSIDQFLKISGR